MHTATFKHVNGRVMTIVVNLEEEKEFCCQKHALAYISTNGVSVMDVVSDDLVENSLLDYHKNLRRGYQLLEFPNAKKGTLVNDGVPIRHATMAIVPVIGSGIGLVGFRDGESVTYKSLGWIPA